MVDALELLLAFNAAPALPTARDALRTGKDSIRTRPREFKLYRTVAVTVTRLNLRVVVGGSEL